VKACKGRAMNLTLNFGLIDSGIGRSFVSSICTYLKQRFFPSCCFLSALNGRFVFSHFLRRELFTERSPCISRENEFYLIHIHPREIICARLSLLLIFCHLLVNSVRIDALHDVHVS